ncbi:uncharacterized protein PFL1_01381 [Pseudozyma flocculosa PF-1]|uniref:pyridoxal kinase n=1 Tax=Pseudozyma flocculosa TaxID=84751 RepID=A0A5C3EZ49_9BASI|nr:uncharacterized protein PFL1_01381 [Pseudozyma flocculosa PF-1]EPQ31193.1 hypothetical protein PFL1_01381 [Pseudozyma flocculosa PF-1]SPO36311.1 related to pyridoxal kinase [Pseudozyma flocculosa]
MSANVPDPSRILSIQSHVVSGYVGNRAATFPLQLLGWDVDVANTVQFSNHTGYGRWGGLRFDSDHLDQLFDGLDKNGLLRYSRMLTGYMPSAAVVTNVLNLVKKLRARTPAQARQQQQQQHGGRNGADDGASGEDDDDDDDDDEGGLIYLLDPVMGDIGRGMYVAPEVLPVYKQMLPYSTIITPNQFEAQVLTGLEVTDLSSLKRVIWTLHHVHGVPHVIITSVALPQGELEKIGATATLPNGQTAMLQVGSSYRTRSTARNSTANATATAPPDGPDDLDVWMIQFPEVDGYFSGVGDLFAALTLGRFRPQETAQERAATADGANGVKSLTPIARAAELAIASLQGILARTSETIDRLEAEEARQSPSAATATNGKVQGEVQVEAEDPAEARVNRMRKRELRIVQSRDEIERPEVVYRARWLP